MKTNKEKRQEKADKERRSNAHYEYLEMDRSNEKAREVFRRPPYGKVGGKR